MIKLITINLRQVTFLLILVSLCSSNGFAQNNIITLKALAGGSEGNATYTDRSTIYINPTGFASNKDSNAFDDWSVTSTSITPLGSLDKTFEILFGGMATVNTTEGINYGKKLTDGGIDRASTGELGIRGSIGNAIDVNEGFYFGLDLSKMNASVSIQITKVYIIFAGLTDEKGVIVSKINPQKRISFGTATGVDVIVDNAENAIDISALNIYLTDRKIDDSILSVFNDSDTQGNFRISGIELKILDNNLDASQVSSLSHPRLLLKAGEEVLIQNLINQSSEFKNVHEYILEESDKYLAAPTLIKPNSDRILDVSRQAIFQIFYLSYAYRMTNNVVYLNKAESVINTVCDFDNWSNYSLDIAEMCFAVAIGYDWLYNDLSAATKQNAREAILNYALNPEKFKGFWELTSNWNQVCIGGYSFGALAIYGDGTALMDSQAAYYLNNILVENPKSMNTYASGNYQEGAMYWSYGTTFEVMMLSALEGVFGENNEGINRLTYTPGFLESAEYMQYVTGPSSLYFNYMDSTAKRTPLPAALWMSKKANNPSYLYQEKKLLQTRGYNTNLEETRFLPIALIYGKDISLENLPQPQSKIWYGYGDQPVAMVRTDWNGSNGKYLGVKAGTPTYSHAQMDGGTFVYDSQGLRWASDLGKYDYEVVGSNLAGLNPPKSHSDFSQNSARWDIFRVSNISHNNISIKKSSETKWQRFKVDGMATLDEIYDTPAKRGTKINLKPLIGLNNELNTISRSIYLANDSYLEIKDEIANGTEPVDLYWNMLTTALVEKLNDSQIKLTQGGKTVVLDITSSNVSVPFTIEINRSTDPIVYNPSATYERKNLDSSMLGFTAVIPANTNVTFTIKLTDGPEVPPSTAQTTNNILLELPTPTTGLEGNFIFSDKSTFYIDNSGNVDITGFSIENAWSVYGETNVNNAFNSQFTFNWDAMGIANTTLGNTYGSLLTRAGIDRSTTGDLGVRGGVSNGIDPNEGFRLGLDLKHMPNSTYLQLLKVGFSTIGGSETGVIVNRNDTSKKMTFGAPGTTSNVMLTTGFVDVENLDILIQGGETNPDLASIFNTSTTEGSFRITKFVFKIIDASTLNLTETLNKKSLVSVYPNPFNNTITIQNNSNKLQIKIFNILGTILIDKTYNTYSNDQKTIIDLQHLNSGVYLLQIMDGEKITSKKIIKN